MNTPVFMTFFVRDQTFSKVFERVRQVKPPVLFLAADGPRKGNKADEEGLERCKRIVENIDWECKVYRLYSEINRGIHVNTYEGLRFAFTKVDRLIFLEDDILATTSFFYYCDYLLEKYKDDTRIQLINGMNHLGIYDSVDSDYFYSKIGSIWGVALWKRTFEAMENELKYLDDSYSVRTMRDNLPKYLRKPYISDAFARREDYKKTNKIKSFELSLNSSKYLNNQVQIVPRYNLITSIGVTSGSAHAPKNIKMLPKGIRQQFFMKTYELEFPLKDPLYCMPDIQYEKRVNRIRGNGYPLVTFYRFLYMGFAKLFTGDIRGLGQSIKRRITRQRNEKV